MDVQVEGRWNAEAHRRIQEVLAAGPGLAAFDFDNTLIFNDLGEACLYYIALQGLLPLTRADFWAEMTHPTLLPQNQVDSLRQSLENVDPDEDYDRYLQFVDTLIGTYHKIAEKEGLESAYRWTRIFFGGQTKEDLQSVARHVLDHECERPIGESFLPSGLSIAAGIRIYPEMETLVREMIRKGWDVRVVTASPELIIRQVAPKWGIDPSHVHGMRLVIGEDDRMILPRIVEPMTYGRGKVTALRENVSESKPLLFAAGDSYTDWDLLTHARTALLIDKGKAELRADAARHGMIIQERFGV